MTYLLLFGRLANAGRARPRRLRLFNAHLDKYLSENDVKSRSRFGRDSINYLLCNGFPYFSFGFISHVVGRLALQYAFIASTFSVIISREFMKPRQQRQRERHRTKGLINKTMAVHLRYNSLYISSPSSAIQQREMTKPYVVWRT